MIIGHVTSRTDGSSADRTVKVFSEIIDYRLIHCPVGTGVGFSADESRKSVLLVPICVIPSTCAVPKKKNS
jgi:hypothetical protein